MADAKDLDAGAPSLAAQGQRQDAPPAYTSENLPPEVIGELNAAFSSLDLEIKSTTVTPDMCLAHLKLLNAFQNLKEDIGYTDGLWQIYNSRALAPNVRVNGAEGEQPEKLLAMLREKRWALYLARAVDRYEAWWDTFAADPITEEDLVENSPKFSGFVESAFSQQPRRLPPIGKQSYPGLGSHNYGKTSDCCRCIDGVACTYAQSSGLSRRLHARRVTRPLELRHALETSEWVH